MTISSTPDRRFCRFVARAELMHWGRAGQGRQSVGENRTRTTGVPCWESALRHCPVVLPFGQVAVLPPQSMVKASWL